MNFHTCLQATAADSCQGLLK